MKRSPRTAYVHIGAPKTGSTAIQSAFSQNREKLCALGYHYLEGDRNHSEVLSMVFWEESDARKLGKFRWVDEPNDFSTYRNGLKSDLCKQVARSAPNDLIISAEGLCEFRKDEVETFLSFLCDSFERIQVIAYAREPQSWMTSAAQQGTKWSGDLLDDTFAAPRLPLYERRFTFFMEAVGRKGFDLRAFKPLGNGFDVVNDFAQAVGIDPCALASENHQRLNSAVSHRTAILFSALNAISPPFVEQRHNPCRAYHFTRDARLPGRKFALPRETILEWQSAIDKENDWLSQHFAPDVFARPLNSRTSLVEWFGDERDELEAFSVMFAQQCRKAQNEKAHRSLWNAQNLQSTNIELARKLLSDACLLTTDRWTLHLIATLAVDVDHPDKKRFFAKQRLMRRIEEPQPDDPPLETGNPFHRPL